eukprot:TRINITY_DN2752_c0_g1_i2.p1 TRINITY_DN2752_c0_g1~~TRINITY_DN2752_c0_g1_i2.p1  ORF type:complete len:728 (+),score=238.67 TRINITY_DN2752_c0_g1_i2:115-2298(+)
MQRVVKLFTLPRSEHAHARHDTITALDCQESVLFIGTSGGVLQKWQCEQEPDSGDYISRQMIQVPLKRKAVQQVILDPTYPRLFVLCEEQVTCHSTIDLMKVFTIPEGPKKTTPLKGCTCIAVAPLHAPHGEHRVCVATKRNLLLYRYTEAAAERFEVLVMPSPVMALAFQGDMLCCGYMKEYSLVNCSSGKPRTLFNTQVHQPQVKLLDTENAVLCCRGRKSDKVPLLDPAAAPPPPADGKPGGPSLFAASTLSIEWESEPCAVGFKHPYVVGLLGDQVQVYSIYEGEIVQKLTNLRGATLACCRTPGPSENLCIATDCDAYMLVTNPVDDQLKQLIAKLLIEEASDLLNRSATGDAGADARRFEQLNIDAGFAYLFRGQPGYAFKHFLQTDIDAREVLTHFQGYLPLALREGWSPDPAYSFNDHSVSLRERYAILLSLPAEPPETARTTQGHHAEPAGAAEQKKKDAAVAELMRETVAEVLSFMNARKAGAPAIQQRCMDYASLYIYVDGGNTEAAYHLLSHDNYCGLEECEALLTQRRLHRMLAWLYCGKGRPDAGAAALDTCDTVRPHAPLGVVPPPRPTAAEALAADLDEVFAAVDSRSPAYLKSVLARCPGKVALKDSMGNTPVHYAATLAPRGDAGDGSTQSEQVALLGVLMTCHADTTTPNSYGVTPLDAAIDASEHLWGVMRAAVEIQGVLAQLPPYAHAPPLTRQAGLEGAAAYLAS